jgi:Chaperone of endosialidase
MGSDVLVTANGRLGVMVSSARFKRDIRDMGEASSGLLKLRPVAFRYKDDQTGTQQYRLVAEEVARIYPELVTYDQNGKILTARYSMLSAMPLNELQKQSSELRQLHSEMAMQKASTERSIAESEARHQRELRAAQAAFEQRLSALERAGRTRMPTPVNF